MAALALGLATASAACKPTALVGYFCRGGVKDDPGSRMKKQVPSLDRAFTSTLARTSRHGHRTERGNVVARAERAFTLSQNGKVVARMTRDGSWLEVTFDDTPEGADRATVSLRSDMPGLMQ